MLTGKRARTICLRGEPNLALATANVSASPSNGEPQWYNLDHVLSSPLCEASSPLVITEAQSQRVLHDPGIGNSRDLPLGSPQCGQSSTDQPVEVVEIGVLLGTDNLGDSDVDSASELGVALP